EILQLFGKSFSTGETKNLNLEKQFFDLTCEIIKLIPRKNRIENEQAILQKKPKIAKVYLNTPAKNFHPPASGAGAASTHLTTDDTALRQQAADLLKKATPYNEKSSDDEKKQIIRT